MSFTVSCFCVFVVLFGVLSALAQPRESTGLYGHYALNRHVSDFRAFEDVPSCCPKYENGTGAGLGFGIVYDVPLSESFRASFRACYTSLNGNFVRSEPTIVSGGVAGRFEHSIQARLSTIGLEPMVQFSPIERIWLSGGIRAAFVTEKTFSQKERIVEPSFGTFPNGQRSRNEINDRDIPRIAELGLGILGGLSIDLPLNREATVLLAPELLYSLPLTQNVIGIDWKTQQLRFGLALKFSPLPPIEQVKRRELNYEIDTIRQTVEPARAGFIAGIEQRTQQVFETEELHRTVVRIRRTDTLRIATEAILRASLRAETGVGTGVPTLLVEEFKSVLMCPLLNYIFFEENSAEIPLRYQLLEPNETSSFVINDVNSSDRLATYYHVLNVVGKRMLQTPEATLTLIGCNAGVGQEKGNIVLSKSRAESVKRYLTRVWGIAEARIAVEARNMPDKAANSQTNDGAEENRRVEIIASGADILAPIVSSDTLSTSIPETVRFLPTLSHDNALLDWSIDVGQGNISLYKQRGTGNPPDTLVWNIGNVTSKKPQSSAPLTVQLVVQDASGKTETASTQLGVTFRSLKSKRDAHSADKEINRFSLILFNVRSTEISSANRRIAEFISSYLTPTSRVTITGFTDRLGDAKQNQMLAEERARATAKELGLPLTSDRVLGIGNAVTYNPDVPEGRLYTRTVDITIETPITE